MISLPTPDILFSGFAHAADPMGRPSTGWPAPTFNRALQIVDLEVHVLVSGLRYHFAIEVGFRVITDAIKAPKRTLKVTYGRPQSHNTRPQSYNGRPQRDNARPQRDNGSPYGKRNSLAIFWRIGEPIA